MDSTIDEALIKKQTLFTGTKFINFKPGTRVEFHYRTIKDDGNKTIIDDSKTNGKPMQLVLGKKFKLDVWEVIVQKMALNEVAEFHVDKSLVQQYPFVSKVIRDQTKAAGDRQHCCGMTLQNQGLGYPDLDDLLSSQSDLIFIIVELPSEYEKEPWQLNDDEKLNAIEDLRQRGNKAFQEKKTTEAQDLYIKALGIVEQLMLKEKPHDTEWLELAKLKVPLLLNFSQCRLLDKDYYTVIEHCKEVIKLEPNNVKAYYRRAKAHVGAWNPNEAKADYNKVVELDPNLSSVVSKELSLLQDEIRARDIEDKRMYQKIF